MDSLPLSSLSTLSKKVVGLAGDIGAQKDAMEKSNADAAKKISDLEAKIEKLGEDLAAKVEKLSKRLGTIAEDDDSEVLGASGEDNDLKGAI